MSFKYLETELNFKLIQLGWNKENIKRDIAFYETEELENIYTQRIDYVLNNDQGVAMAVINLKEFKEESILKENEDLIKKLADINIPFLILINSLSQIVFIDTQIKKEKNIKIEELNKREITESFENKKRIKYIIKEKGNSI